MFINLNLNQLRVFHAVATGLSFTRASEELNLTQPGISKHIKELEGYYGTRLFDRLGKKVALTHAGKILFTATEDIFNSIKESKAKIDDLRGLASGKLDIGANISIGIYILPEILVKFRNKYPGIEMKVDLSECHDLVEKLINNTLEIGFLCEYSDHKKLVTKEFKPDHLVLIVSKKHKWAKRKTPVSLQDLVDQPFVIPKQGAGSREILEDLLGKAGITLRNPIEFGNIEGIKKAVESDLGISIISKHVALRELAAGLIKSISLTGVDLKRKFYVAYRKDKYLSQAARAFLAFL